MSIYSTSGWP